MASLCEGGNEPPGSFKSYFNILAVRAIPGRTLSTTRCRHPDCSELETLGHVLGQCPKGELLINARHHRVRHALAISLKTLNWEIHEEVHCVSSDGSFRRADIIAINGRLKRALVLDPTIRFERNLNQATEVDIEKKTIYEPCLPYLSQKCNIRLIRWEYVANLQVTITGVAQSIKALAFRPEFRSGASSISAWADYLFGFFPKFSPTVRNPMKLISWQDDTLCFAQGETDASDSKKIQTTFLTFVQNMLTPSFTAVDIKSKVVLFRCIDIFGIMPGPISLRGMVVTGHGPYTCLDDDGGCGGSGGGGDGDDDDDDLQ
ncbi:hypothetical protein ANN_21383 [Periplaneta americana]|uniref:Reverse transcriptase n=1 Tax=Periplaneta americana TaxID=6978 RepID=A0ABQ8SF84_PERAM|nr:hypothetical protein ANN_21383 [Periplaneta americana]